MLENVRIVLVGTTHPGNIGASARAMKNTCLRELHLVAPERFPCAEATARASGADDVLVAARVHTDLEAALAGCAFVVGASARQRTIRWPVVSAEQAASEIAVQARSQPVAIVFGREHSGLTNAELERCHRLLCIPANPVYSSLNLAAAVQIVGYELLKQSALDAMPPGPDDVELAASAEQMDAFYEHLQRALVGIGFLDPDNPRQLMRRMRRMFNRTRPTQVEIDMLRGVLRAALREGKYAVRQRSAPGTR